MHHVLLWIRYIAALGGIAWFVVAPSRAIDWKLGFRAWRDPQEGSFTVDVPAAGYGITGGVAWNSIYVARQWVKVRGGDALIFIGDPEALPRLVPSAALDSIGWRAGTINKNPAGTRLYMEPYETGEQFAANEARTVCQKPRDLGNFRLQAATAALTRSLMPFANYVRTTITAGEQVFECGAVTGYTEAVTLLVGQNTGGEENWDVFAVGGYSATNQTAFELARQIYLRMIATFAVDPQWQANVNAHLGVANQTLIEATDAARRMMLDSGRRALDAHTVIVNRWSNIILGQEHRCTATGECQMTPNTCDYMWKNGNGMFCGPSDGSPPPLALGPWLPTEITSP